MIDDVKWSDVWACYQLKQISDCLYLRCFNPALLSIFIQKKVCTLYSFLLFISHLQLAGWSFLLLLFWSALPPPSRSLLKKISLRDLERKMSVSTPTWGKTFSKYERGEGGRVMTGEILSSGQTTATSAWRSPCPAREGPWNINQTGWASSVWPGLSGTTWSLSGWKPRTTSTSPPTPTPTQSFTTWGGRWLTLLARSTQVKRDIWSILSYLSSAGLMSDDYTSGIKCPYEIQWKYYFQGQWFVDPTLKFTCTKTRQQWEEEQSRL